MAKNSQVSNVGVNAEADAFGALFNSGYLRIYAGSQPANADTALTAQTLLAELRFNTTAFPAASGGVLTANAITSGVASASGTAAFFRCLKSDGTTVLLDGTCDISANSPNITLPTTTITAGVTVSITSFVHTVNKASAGL